MKIFGNQYDFALTVGASAKIAEMCPDGDLSRIGEVLSGNNFSETAKNGAEIVVAMASAADAVKRFEGAPAEHPALTVEMLFALSQADFMAAMTEAMSAFGRDSKPTIEVEPSKKEENGE